MLKLVIGEPLPFDPGKISEGVVPVVEGAGLGVYLLYSNLQNKEIKGIQEGELHYGLFNSEAIPFFVINAPGVFDFVVSIDLNRETPEIRKKWFTEGNVLSLILCDYPSLTVRALRMIGIDPLILGEFKTMCFDSINREIDYNEAATEIQSRWTNKEMMEATEMHRSTWTGHRIN
jgi:hypothetical protein